MIEALVFFSSLVFAWWIQIGSVFEFPKVILFEVFVLINIFWLLFKNSLHITQIKTYVKQHIWIIPLVFLILFDLISFQTNTSIFGNPYRLQGIFLLILCMIFSFLVHIQKNHNKNLSNISFFSIIILFGLTLILGFTEESGRLVGTVGNPNALAGVVLFSWPYLLSSHKTKSNRFKLILGVLCVLILIFLTASRSALIGFVIQTIILFLIYKNVSIIKSVKIGILLVVLCLVLPFVSKSGLLENRSEIWQTAAVSGLSSPIVGHGFGNIEQSIRVTAENMKNNLRFQ